MPNNFIITELGGGLGYTWSEEDLELLDGALEYCLQQQRIQHPDGGVAPLLWDGPIAERLRQLKMQFVWLKAGVYTGRDRNEYQG